MENEIKQIIQDAKKLKSEGYSDKQLAEFVHIELGNLMVYDNNYSVGFDYDISKNQEGSKTKTSEIRQAKMLSEKSSIKSKEQVCKGMAEIYTAILSELGIDAKVVAVKSKEEVEGEVGEDGSVIDVPGIYSASFYSDYEIHLGENEKSNDNPIGHYYSIVKLDEGEFIQDFLTEQALTKIKIGETEFGSELPGFHRKEEHRERTDPNNSKISPEYVKKIQEELSEYMQGTDDDTKVFDFIFEKLKEHIQGFGFEEAKEFVMMYAKSIIPRGMIKETPIPINLVKEDEENCEVICVYRYGEKNYMLRGGQASIDVPLGEVSTTDIEKVLEQGFVPRNLDAAKKMERIKNERSPEKVKNFIDRISQLDGVDVIEQGAPKYQEFIDGYLIRMRKLLERKHIGEAEDILTFLESNLKRNVKYIVQVEYTEEEKKLGDYIGELTEQVDEKDKKIREKIRSEIEKRETKKSSYGITYLSKRETGARPGQYIQGRIVYSNRNENEDILKDHETTHAARLIIYNKNGDIVIPNFDELFSTTHSDEYLEMFPSTSATAGYDYGEVDENGKTNENIPNAESIFQFMEICTESIAGMMNDEDEKSFENGKFSIPTKRMSAISYMADFRDMLIMAIGSDDFIFDMLKEDTSEGYQKLNEKMSQLKKGANIFELLSLYLYLDANGKKIDDEGKKKLLDEQFEIYLSEMFIKRMENCQSIDKSEQIIFFGELIKTEKAKDMVKCLQAEIRRKNAETVSYFHDQKSEFAMEQINSGKESLGFTDPIKAKKAETPIFTEQEIGKATIHTPVEQKQEAERVSESDIKKTQELEDEKREQ